MSLSERKTNVYRLTYLALLSAVVVVLQLLGAFIRFGMFEVTLVLVPIVLGAAICGPLAGAWLGFVFGMTVLLSGSAAAFLTIDPFGTIVTVLAKGVLAGLAAGLVFALLRKYNLYLAVFAAAVVCPIVNTGIFVLGSFVFFLDDIALWAAGEGMSAVQYIFFVLVGGNFFFELLFNVVLGPAVIRLLSLVRRGRAA